MLMETCRWYRALVSLSCRREKSHCLLLTAAGEAAGEVVHRITDGPKAALTQRSLWIKPRSHTAATTPSRSEHRMHRSSSESARFAAAGRCGTCQ